MGFKFIGKFVITGHAKLKYMQSRSTAGTNWVWASLDKTLALIPDSDDRDPDIVHRLRCGDQGDQHFTVWQVGEEKQWPDSGTNIILRAANGMYFAQPGKEVAANTLDQNQAAVFTCQYNPEFNWFELIHSSNWGERMYMLADDLQQPARLFIGNNTVGSPNHVSDQMTYQGTQYDFSYEGFTFQDITPSVAAIQKANGAVDISWLYWPEVGLMGTNLQSSNMRGVVLSGDEALHNDSQWQNSDLRLADFSGAVFSGVNLSGARVDGALFTGTSLQDANLTGVDFRKVGAAGDHGRTGLSGSSFSGANMTGANFGGCDLRNTFFNLGDSIFDTNFEGTDFSSTVLTNDPLPNSFEIGDGRTGTTPPTFKPFIYNYKFSTNPDKPTKFCDATLAFEIINLDWSCLNLTGATITALPHDLSGLKASHLIAQRINLSNRILKNAVFDDADLTGANFAQADLTGASFARAKLTGATFSQATLNGANLNAAQLGDLAGTSAANLSYANMRGTIFDHANLDNCNFDRAQWYGSVPKDPPSTDVQFASGANASLQEAKFANAILSELRLNEAHIEKADFANAVLVGAQLNGAWAQGAVFTEAHLQGVNFTGANLQGARLDGASVAFEHGVFLFDLDGSYRGDLNDLNVSSQLQEAFRTHAYALQDSPSVTVDAPGDGGGWTVLNTASVPPTTSAYSAFKIVANSSGRLLVYGSAIYVTQVDDNGHPQTSTVPYSATILTKDICTLSDETSLPNGQPFSELGHGYTWEQLMTAIAPPKPPPCVSTGNDWDCPAQQP
jgi:uncharacterized protein YjbI with pentapeptide repeats